MNKQIEVLKRLIEYVGAHKLDTAEVKTLADIASRIFDNLDREFKEE